MVQQEWDWAGSIYLLLAAPSVTAPEPTSKTSVSIIVLFYDDRTIAAGSCGGRCRSNIVGNISLP